MPGRLPRHNSCSCSTRNFACAPCPTSPGLCLAGGDVGPFAQVRSVAGIWALKYVVIIALIALDVHQFPPVTTSLVEQSQVPPVELPWVLRRVRLRVELTEIDRPVVRAEHYREPVVVSAGAIVVGNRVDDKPGILPRSHDTDPFTAPPAAHPPSPARQRCSARRASPACGDVSGGPASARRQRLAGMSGHSA